MRNDSLGLFWEDFDERVERKREFLFERGWEEIRTKWYKPSKNPNDDYIEARLELDVAYKIERAVGEKCEPPEPVWLKPDYLPNLEEALAFEFEYVQYQELVDSARDRTPFVFDIECYVNYFLIAFRSLKTKNIFYFESYNNSPMNLDTLKWCMENLLVIGFNSNHYDVPIASIAVAGKDNATLKQCTNEIIAQNERAYFIMRRQKVKQLTCDHIDIKELPRSFSSLKIYGGRVHSKRMQDLPFHEATILNPQQVAIIRWYCINDLDTTIDLYNEVTEELELRYKMSVEYRTDLRSKSDAQIAEAVFRANLQSILGKYPKKVTVDPGTTFSYEVPHFVKFKTPMMNDKLWLIKQAVFEVLYNGKVAMPEELKKLVITIADAKYKMGIGGLHSQEKKVSHYSDEIYTIEEIDVESYYPRTIINQNITPLAIGPYFQKEFIKIVDTRLDAKHRGDKVVSDSLKIVINGTFGKLGSPHSILYNPMGLIQTTLSGQLALLMLIEELELAGVTVISANTDGIVVKKPNARKDEINAMVRRWEAATGYTMEHTPYKAIHSRDVNNYIAFKESGGSKVKGALGYAGLAKNPTNEICIDAVTKYLEFGTPIEDTVNACDDIRKFVSVRNVTGGGYKDGEFLGKAIRWYYSSETDGTIIYAKSGKKVPRTEGAKPCLLLPDSLPTDIDRNWYIGECYDILNKVGVEV